MARPGGRVVRDKEFLVKVEKFNVTVCEVDLCCQSGFVIEMFVLLFLP